MHNFQKVANGKVYTVASEYYIWLKTTMSEGEYLYGVNIVGLSAMKNEYAYKLKNELSSKLIRKLFETHFLHQDTARVSASFEAQKFNNKLLDEMYENDKNNLAYHLDDRNEEW